MKLHYWNGTNVANRWVRNFGDELNPFIWKNLLGDVFNDNDDRIFLGIGSLLNDNLERDLPADAQKIVFGAGVGYGRRPLQLDKTYQVYFVRGPLSTQALGLDASYATTDGAMLIRHFVPEPNRVKVHKYGYMPHWTNHTSRLQQLCEDRDIFYISPTRSDVMEVVDEILSCEVIFAEAMHAAIIADALRVPWVPVKSTQEVIPFKWLDWCKSAKVPYNPYTVLPLWEPQDGQISIKQRFKELLVSRELKRIVKKHKPVLSKHEHADRLFSRLNEKLNILKSDLAAHAA